MTKIKDQQFKDRQEKWLNSYNNAKTIKKDIEASTLKGMRDDRENRKKWQSKMNTYKQEMHVKMKEK